MIVTVITNHPTLPKSAISSPVEKIMKGRIMEKLEKKHIVVGSLITVKVKDMDKTRKE